MIDRAKMIAEILELTAVPSIDPERDITAKELGAALSIDPTNVARKMKPWVKKGMYGTALKRDPRTRRDHRVWWKIEGPEIGVDSD